MTRSQIQSDRYRHDRQAPFWAAGLVLFQLTGLATIRFDLGPFWKGYVLDMAGPAWVYILIRGKFTTWSDTVWTRFFTPSRTLLLLIFTSFGIEFLQYLEVYNSTFDPFDLAAYVSILVPLFTLDILSRRESKRKAVPKPQ